MPAKEVVETAVDLGDKLHQNFNQTANMLWQRGQAGQELDENKRQFDKNYALEQMLARLKAQDMQSDVDWEKKFRLGMMK